jgi:formylglycine-generating enzyme required for sulfatase activity
MRSAFASAVTGGVALFATVVGARAQETEERYWRTRMGPSVLTIEQETENASKPGSEFTECVSGCPAMIVVPAGSFKMGSPATEADRSPNEGPQHEVTIAKPFAVGRTEVTFAQWDACVAAGACRKLGDNAWGISCRRQPHGGRHD